MVISTEQLEQRKHFIGGSDVAAIFNEHPYKSRYDVWADKVGILMDAEPASLAMRVGTALEPGILDLAEDELGPLTRGEHLIGPADSHLGVNLDGRTGDGIPVEAKTAAFGSLPDSKWGEEGTDQVPNFVILQCHAQMVCCDKGLCWVPALVSGQYKLYRLERDEDLVVTMLEKCHRFWEDLVIPKIPPANSGPSMDIAKRLIRVPEKAVNIDDELAAKFLSSKEALKVAKAEAEDVKEEMLAALGDAEAGVTMNYGAFTFYSQTRKAHEVKESTFRVLRQKKKGL